MNKYDNIDVERIKAISSKTESYSETIEKIVGDIVNPYSKDLDRYVAFIRNCLEDGERRPSDMELEDYCMNLSTQIYWVSAGCERLGIRDDISKAIYREIYNTARQIEEKGTVADKDSIAELKSQQELLTNVCYNRAFKILRAKVENAQEILSACKKVLSRRISELELTRIKNG